LLCNGPRVRRPFFVGSLVVLACRLCPASAPVLTLLLQAVGMPRSHLHCCCRRVQPSLLGLLSCRRTVLSFCLLSLLWRCLAVSCPRAVSLGGKLNSSLSAGVNHEGDAPADPSPQAVAAGHRHWCRCCCLEAHLLGWGSVVRLRLCAGVGKPQCPACA
jgi:hypothetical protein